MSHKDFEKAFNNFFQLKCRGYLNETQAVNYESPLLITIFTNMCSGERIKANSTPTKLNWTFFFIEMVPKKSNFNREYRTRLFYCEGFIVTDWKMRMTSIFLNQFKTHLFKQIIHLLLHFWKIRTCIEK